MLYFWIMYYYYYLLTWTFVWIISLDLTVESTFYFEHLVYFHVDLLGPPPCGKADHQERVQHGDLTNENSKILPMQHFIPVEGTTNRQPMWSMNKRDWRITIPMEPSWNIETGPASRSSKHSNNGTKFIKLTKQLVERASSVKSEQLTAAWTPAP